MPERPLSVHAAKGLVAHIHSGDLVYIITGFVLLPWKQPETDGMVSSMMLARFLIKAFDCTPVLVVPGGMYGGGAAVGHGTWLPFI